MLQNWRNLNTVQRTRRCSAPQMRDSAKLMEKWRDSRLSDGEAAALAKQMRERNLKRKPNADCSIESNSRDAEHARSYIGRPK